MMKKTECKSMKKKPKPKFKKKVKGIENILRFYEKFPAKYYSR